MTDKFFAFHWCLCVSISFILFILFHKRTARNVMGEKLKMCPSLLPQQHFPSCWFSENAQQKGRKCHFRDPNLKNFLKKYAPRPPSLTFLPGVRTSCKSGLVNSRNHQAYFIIFHLRWRINGKFAHSLTHQKMPRHETLTSLLIWWRGKGPTSLWVQKCKRTPTWLLLQKKNDSCASAWAYVYVQAVVKVKYAVLGIDCEQSLIFLFTVDH